MVPEVFGIASGTEPVPVLKPGFGGIGGQKLFYNPRDDWNCQKSTEERHGWSSYRPKTATVRETFVGGDTPGLPNWIRKERQVRAKLIYQVCKILGPELYLIVHFTNCILCVFCKIHLSCEF